MSEPNRPGHGVDRLITASLVLLFLGAWEGAARSGWISSTVFPPPTAILADYADLWERGLAANVASTLARFSAGLVGGGVPGILLGLFLGWSPRLRRIVDPLVAAAHSIPKIVLFPLLLAIFGASEFSKLASISLSVFFPALINSAAGARDIPPLYFEVVRGYGGRGFDLFRHVIVPGSLPMILTGLRIAANIGLLVTIAIEFTIASSGIGSIIWLSWQTMKMEDLYAGVILLSFFGISMNAALQWSLRRVAPWQRGG